MGDVFIIMPAAFTCQNIPRQPFYAQSAWESRLIVLIPCLDGDLNRFEELVRQAYQRDVWLSHFFLWQAYHSDVWLSHFFQ